MPDNVIDLQKERAERQPHWAGEVICLGCAHTWQGVAPMGRVDGLECPSCGAHRGVIRHNFGPREDELVATCMSCANDVFIPIVEGECITLLCIACGSRGSLGS